MFGVPLKFEHDIVREMQGYTLGFAGVWQGFECYNLKIHANASSIESKVAWGLLFNIIQSMGQQNYFWCLNSSKSIPGVNPGVLAKGKTSSRKIDYFVLIFKEEVSSIKYN